MLVQNMTDNQSIPPTKALDQRWIHLQKLVTAVGPARYSNEAFHIKDLSAINETMTVRELKELFLSPEQMGEYSYRVYVYTKDEYPQFVGSFGETNGSRSAHTIIVQDHIDEVIASKKDAIDIIGKENIQLILVLTPFLRG